jgi:hypothetical protein
MPDKAGRGQKAGFARLRERDNRRRSFCSCGAETVRVQPDSLGFVNSGGAAGTSADAYESRVRIARRECLSEGIRGMFWSGRVRIPGRYSAKADTASLTLHRVNLSRERARW